MTIGKLFLPFKQIMINGFLLLLVSISSACLDPYGDAEGVYEEGKFYYFSGNVGEGTLVAGQKTGLWTFWDDKRNKLSQGRYNYDKKNGPWTFWHLNGQKMSEGDFKQDERIMDWKFWYYNGQLKEIRNYEGGKNLLMSSWTTEGREMVVNGSGPYIFYHENVLRESGFYKDGLPDSTWVIFDENGVEKERFILRNGRRL